MYTTNLHRLINLAGWFILPCFLKGEKMQVYKDGIEKTIRESQWQTYKERGYIQIAENREEQRYG